MRLILKTYGTIGKENQVSIILIRALDIGNASYLQRGEVKRVKSKTLHSLQHLNCRILKIISIRGVNKKI